jgi:3-oxoacyl-[acyl-carrier-protein] synthase III
LGGLLPELRPRRVQPSSIDNQWREVSIQGVAPSPSGADIRIAAIGSYIPAQRVSNADKLAAFGLDAEFLRTKLGITMRAVKDAAEETSDLCVKAFADLAAQVRIAPSDAQLCCVVTQNPDVNIPHTAAIVHQKLGLAKPCMTFDLSQGCAGYTHGIAIVSSLMERLGLDHALLFTCDPYSKVVDPEDKNTALIFGDAASVSYLSRSGHGYALVDASFGTAPGTSSCLISHGALKATANADLRSTLKMDGTAVLFHAAHEVPGSIRALLEKNGKTLDDIDLFLLHPGSKRVVDLIRKDLQLESAKVPFEIAEYGNTVSSSIPLMLKQHVIQKKLPRLMLSGFGVGFSWGSCLIELRD